MRTKKRGLLHLKMFQATLTLLSCMSNAIFKGCKKFEKEFYLAIKFWSELAKSFLLFYTNLHLRGQILRFHFGDKLYFEGKFFLLSILYILNFVNICLYTRATMWQICDNLTLFHAYFLIHKQIFLIVDSIYIIFTLLKIINTYFISMIHN